MQLRQQIVKPVATTLVIKHSKFIAIAEPVHSAEEAENKVMMWREKHPKANHHCYAYRLGASGEIYRANDDGEPSGTAGLPIYRQLQSAHASYTLVTVVRYFGGILLGAGGLVKAYKQAAKSALEIAQWTEIIPQAYIEANCNYSAAHIIMREAEQAGFKVIEQLFDLRCRFLLQGASAQAPIFCATLAKHGITTQIRTEQ